MDTTKSPHGGERRRRWSKEQPPDLSDLMNKIIELSDSFIREFEQHEPRMKEIVQELMRIADEAVRMHKETDELRKKGVAVGAAGAVGAVVATGAAGAVAVGLLTGGLGFVALGAAAALEAVAAAAGAAGAVAAVGGSAVVTSNVRKRWGEKDFMRRVENLGETFMKIVEPMKENLEEIKTTCEKLEETSTELQAKNTLSEVQDFQSLLRQVTELKKMSVETVDVVVIMYQKVREMFALILAFFRLIPNPEQDKKVRDYIIRSANQCETVTKHLDRMSTELRKFRGQQRPDVEFTLTEK